MELLQKYAREAFRALEYIHNKGIIHCDIKLANMGLHKESEESEGDLKIFDFGLSVFADSEIEGKAHLDRSVGTMGYMAPELHGVSVSFTNIFLMFFNYREIFLSALKLTSGH